MVETVGIHQLMWLVKLEYAKDRITGVDIPVQHVPPRVQYGMVSYTPWSNADKDEIFHDADEIKTFGDEAPFPTGRLRDLLNHINITTAPEFRIKRIPCPGYHTRFLRPKPDAHRMYVQDHVVIHTVRM
jgi:hypothetical protein